MNIRYSANKKDLEGLNIDNFFADWPKKPSNGTLIKSIINADYVVFAIDDENNDLAGYITALSDKVLSAYIPFLEVRRKYQGNGIGSHLVTEMLSQLEHLYMIDLVCDKELENFYKRQGFKPWNAMIKRNYNHQ